MSPTILGIAVPLITFVLLTAVGSSLTTGDFRHVWRRLGLVVAGLAVPPLVLPALAMTLVAWRDPPPATASGLLLIAICPVGGISNTFTYLARGSTALSLTLTALSCLLAIVTIPILASVAGHVAGGPSIVRLPPSLLLIQLLATVIVPVSLGMLVRRRWPELADACQPWLQRTGFVLLGLLLVLVILADTRGFVRGLSHAVPLAAVFIAGSFAVGGGIGHLLGGDVPERIALAIEFATRNVAVATTLAVAAGRIDFATFATTYFLTELPLMTSVALVFRRAVGSPPAAAAPASTLAATPARNSPGLDRKVPSSK